MSSAHEAEEIFDLLLQQPSEKRAAVVSQACGVNEALRERVEALLRAHNQQPDFLPEEPREASDLPASEAPGSQIGPYKLMEKLGEGGFGAVWVAVQSVPLQRKVALKIIKLGMDTKQVVARFEAERQALALMEHPNIAKVLDAGATDHGRPYFVMEFVRGLSLTKYCDQEQLNTIARLELFIQVCHAIQHAHQKGVIHRDIKPSNIMVTLHDGVPVPRVIDFGIAKATQQALTDKTIYTRYSQFIGTPAYMSPEQAEMSGLDIDTRCDIYSLGVLLYELLIGRPPFDPKELTESSLEEMRHIICEREPQRPSTKLLTLEDADQTMTAEQRSTNGSRLVGLLRGDLDWIVLKCLEKDRTRRYETARDLAADVVRFLNDEPVEATPPSPGYRIRKLVKRHTGRIAAASALAAALIVGLVVSLWQTRSAIDAKHAESEQRNLALSNAKKATRIAETRRAELYAAQISLAQRAWHNGNLRQAQDLLDAQRPEPGQTDLRGFEWRYLWQLCQDESKSMLEPFSGSPVKWYDSNIICFSCDGSKLAMAEGSQVSIWDFAAGRKIASLDSQANRVSALAFSPTDPDLLAVVGLDDESQWSNGTLHFWNLEGKISSSFFADVAAVESLSFSPDGRKLAAGRFVGKIEIWDIVSRTLDQSWQGHRDSGNLAKHRPALCVAFSPNGEILASGGGDTKIRFWNPSTGEQIGEALSGHTAFVNALAFSPDGQLLASGGFDSRIFIWDVETKEAHPPLLGHIGRVTSVEFSPDGETLVSGGLDHTIRSWSVSTVQQTSILRGHKSGVHSLAFSRDGQSLVSCSEKSARAWDLPSALNQEAQIEHGTWVSAAALSPDGKTLVAADYHTLVLKLWDVPTRSLREDLIGPTDVTNILAFSPDGMHFASGILGGKTSTVHLWDVKAGEQIETFPCEGDVRSITFSSDSKVLGWTSKSGGLRFWDIAARTEIELIKAETSSIRDVVFSKVGHLLVTKNKDHQVSIWDTRDGSEVRSLHGGKGTLLDISRDGRRIALGAGWGSITVLDVQKGEIEREIHQVSGHSWAVMSLAFTPDSKTLVSASHDSRIKFWNIASGQAALTVGHLGAATSISFSADGKLMATSGADGMVRLWPAASLSEADAVVGDGGDR